MQGTLVVTYKIYPRNIEDKNANLSANNILFMLKKPLLSSSNIICVIIVNIICLIYIF